MNSSTIYNSINRGFNNNNNNNQNSDCGCDNKDFSNLTLAGESTVTYTPKSSSVIDLRGLTLANQNMNPPQIQNIPKKKGSCSINNLQKKSQQPDQLNPINAINYLDPSQAGNTSEHNHEDNEDNPAENIKDTVIDTYSFAVKNINLAFVLIAAFAWNDAIKFFIARLIKLERGTPYYYLYYALIITLLAVIVFRISSRFTK